MTATTQARSRAAESNAPYIARVTLGDFRGYGELALAAAPGITVLVGENGAGKTNLLEALSFLAPGRGLRGAALGSVLRRSAPPGAAWTVAARIASARGWTDVGTGLAADGAGERRQARIDGKPARGLAPLARVLGITWLTPAMDGLFRDGAGLRRRFLDRLTQGHDAGHAERLAAYERGLRERSRLLAEGRRDPAWLAALEASMARHGIAVAASRLDAIARLGAALGAAAGPFPSARVDVQGTIEDWVRAMPAISAEERFAASLAESRARDADAGGASVGPHRSDLAVWHGESGTEAAACSTGEQKALLVAILLADARSKAGGELGVPVLLLDEVAAHLDERRRRALFEALLDLGAQAWLTGTDRASFAALAGRARFLDVEAGAIREAAA